MVFFLAPVEHVVHISPQHLGPRLADDIRKEVEKEVLSGSFSSELGVVLSILDLNDESISSGYIDHLTGNTKFIVRFRAIVFRPFKGEVLDGTAFIVTREVVMINCGPLKVAVRVSESSSYKWTTNCYTCTETGRIIASGTKIRFKVLGTNEEFNTKSPVIGDISEPFLGPIE